MMGNKSVFFQCLLIFENKIEVVILLHSNKNKMTTFYSTTSITYGTLNYSYLILVY